MSKARAKPGRRLAGILVCLGVIFLLGGLAVRPFAAEAQALLEEPRAMRFFSCLYDHGSLGRSLTGGQAYWTPPGMAEVSNMLRDRCPLGLVTYYFRITDAELAFKVTAIAEAGTAPPFVRLGEGAVLGSGAERDAFLETFGDFDPAGYPVNAEALRLVLSKAAARDWRHNRALASHHALWALLLLPVEGFTSLCRLAVTPLILSGGVKVAAVLGTPWTLAPGSAMVLTGVLLWDGSRRPRRRD